MFILFNKKLFNSNGVSLIERKVSTSEPITYAICLTTGHGQEEFEKFKTIDIMNRRFDRLCEHVGINACGDY